MKKLNFKRLLSVVMAICIMASIAVPTFAVDTIGKSGYDDKVKSQSTDSATIDRNQKGSIELYKIDFTNAEKDGVWSTNSYVSTGMYDEAINQKLIDNATRTEYGNDNKAQNANGNTVGGQDGVLDDDDLYADDDNNGYIQGGEVIQSAGEHTQTLGNGQTSNGYAIKGVIFKYLKVAEIVTYSETEDGAAKLMTLYGFNIETDTERTSTTGLLSVLGLSLNDAYDVKGHDQANDGIDGINTNKYAYFESDVLTNALRAKLNENPTSVKTALENYMVTRGTAMPETDANGYTYADGLPLGLYLLVETKVPEHVTNTTNPFFVSVPMTTSDGGNTGNGIDKGPAGDADKDGVTDGIDVNDTDTSDSNDGGASWLYDITLYPKNETGIPSLEKTVRESAFDTGKNQGLITGDYYYDKDGKLTKDTDGTYADVAGNLAINDGYDHFATVSGGDILEYQILVTLPTITSKATGLSNLSLVDTLGQGITYNDGSFKFEWFRDENCLDKITEWDSNSGKFVWNFVPAQGAAGADAAVSVLTLDMTAAGLAEINGLSGMLDTSTELSEGSVWNTDKKSDQIRRGYSDCTLRITYTAKFDSNNTINVGEMGNANHVVMTWKRSNAAYYDTLVDDCHVYTFGIDLTKLFEGETPNIDHNASFKDVEFVLWNKTDGYWVMAQFDADEGCYYVTNHIVQSDGKTPVEGHDDDGTAGNDTTFGQGVKHDSPAAHAGLTAQEAAVLSGAVINGAELTTEGKYADGHETMVFVPVTKGSLLNNGNAEDDDTSDDGRIIIKGLEDDEYVLTEIRTANGYTLLKSDIVIDINYKVNEEICKIYATDTLGLLQNDPRYASMAAANNVATVLNIGTDANGAVINHDLAGLGGVANDVTGTVTGQNIPQKQLVHHMIDVSATVDGNDVTMLPDEGTELEWTVNNANALNSTSTVVTRESENALVPLTIVNTHGFDLPQTGELGVILMPLAGMLGICACCFFLFVMRKKEQEETVA